MSRMIIIIMQWVAGAEAEAEAAAEAGAEAENPPMRMPVVRHLGALMCHNECIRESTM